MTKALCHKDLRSKNVFVEGCRAVIADFGLHSMAKLCRRRRAVARRGHLLPVTKECVYYMAPELVRLIGTEHIDSAFSHASDVFAFGYVYGRECLKNLLFKRLFQAAIFYFFNPVFNALSIKFILNSEST